MKSRLCIIGNSHIACLKTAWDEMTEYRSRVACTFFGSPGAGMRAMVLDDTCLRPQTEVLKRDIAVTSGGHRAVNILDYDAFLLAGMGFFTPVLDSRLSSAVLGHALRETFSGSVPHRLALALRSVTEAPVYIGATPRKGKAGEARGAVNVLGAAEVSSALTRAFQDERLTFIPQPPETMRSPWSTKQEFVSAAPRLVHTAKEEAEFHRNEGGHMNTAYGKIYLERFFQILPTAPASSKRSAGAKGQARAL